jgi:endonuclease YncB( thermonuclease family)
MAHVGYTRHVLAGHNSPRRGLTTMKRHRGKPLAAIVVALLALACAATTHAAASRPSATAVVARVVDGDTLTLTNGARIRLVQIDTPELGGGECYSRAAARELRRLAPVGAAVRLEADPRLDRVDRYGRLLRYVWRGSTNVNVELVRRGAATVWFYDGDRGKYASTLLRTARAARAAKRGLWGACRAVWNPYAAATTSPRSGSGTTGHSPGRRCDPSYPTVCIPPPPPDLDCGDIPYHDFVVRPPDRHGFDGRDNDGLGCES